MAAQTGLPLRTSNKEEALNSDSSPEEITDAAPPAHDARRVGVWGIGRLGASLAYWLSKSGITPSVLVTRTQAKGAELARVIADESGDSANAAAIRVTSALDQAFEACDLLFVCLPDRLLGGVPQLLQGLQLDGRELVHTSGATPASILDPLRDQGAGVGAFHPIQSFGPFEPSAHNPFSNISIGCEAAQPLMIELERVAKMLGAQVVRVASDIKARACYHASAVIASNALVTLMDASIQVMGLAGIDPDAARQALIPLMRGSVENLAKLSPGEALTGPVARGDVDTIERHLLALRDAPELASLYADLCARTVLLAEGAGRISASQREHFVALLMREMNALDE